MTTPADTTPPAPSDERPEARSWFEYEYLMTPDYGLPGWRRTRFYYRRKALGIDADPTGDQAEQAHEMLIVISTRHRAGCRFRLVRVTEEHVGDQIETPKYR